MLGLGRWFRIKHEESHTYEAHDAKNRAEEKQRQVQEQGVQVDRILADLRRMRKKNNLAAQLRREIRGF